MPRTKAGDFGARVYDSRLSRFLSTDPLSKENPHQSTYLFADNSPIQLIDFDGKSGDDPITPKIGGNTKQAKAMGTSAKKYDLLIISGSLYVPGWKTAMVDIQISEGSRIPKLKLTDDETNSLAATVIAEAGTKGMTFSQLLYLANLYYNDIYEAKGNVVTGLRNSKAYETTERKISPIDGKYHSYYRGPNKWVKSMLVSFGFSKYENDIVTIDGKPMTVSQLNKTSIPTENIKNAHDLAGLLKKTILSNYYDNPLSSTFLNQGYYGDLNRPDDPEGTKGGVSWTQARAYYLLQEQGKVKNAYVVELTRGADTTFLINQEAIKKYFIENPTMLPTTVPQLSEKQFPVH